MKLVLLGAPGAGKGTQAERISIALDIPTLSTGNLLREAIAQGTELGRKVEGCMEHGCLVPDELIVGLVRDRLARPDCVRGVIFDGFPRTVRQAQALGTIADIDVALSLEVSDRVIEQRMTGRRTCPKCQTTYHVQYNPPKQDGVCDKCGAQLSVRHDDEPDVVKNRLRVYHEETEPVKHYYEDIGKLKMVESQEDVSETTAMVFQTLGVSL